MEYNKKIHIYKLDPIINKYDINLPTGMYKMKSQCESIGNNDEIGSSKESITNSYIDKSIYRRQEKVLKELDELKLLLKNIRSKLGDTEHNSGLIKEPQLRDIVINGHPNFIPYALLSLKNAWKNLFTINVRTFTHSTMPDIGQAAKDFETKLSQIPVDPTRPKINISLIWKNCEHTEMICSRNMYVPIYGEVNIIRYLARMGPIEYRYENSPLSNEIDVILDICYQLLRCTTPKSRACILNILNYRLKKQKYFGGNTLSIADIAVDSSLQRLPVITPLDLTPALTAWRKRVQAVTLTK